MPIPVPRLAWETYAVAAGENDLIVLRITNGASTRWFTGVIAPATYATPETLLAAFVVAAEGATDYAAATFGAEADVTATVPAGLVTVAADTSDPADDPFLHFGDITGWTATTVVALGDLRGTATRIYVCTTAGETGGTAPTGEIDPVTDGAAEWSYRGTIAAMEAVGTLLGFPLSDAEAASATATTALSGVWSPDVPVREDVEREFESVVSQVETAGGQNKATRWTPTAGIGGRRTYRRVRFAYLAPARTFAAEAGVDTVALETFWLSDGIGQFTYAPDRTDPTVGAADYFVREESAREFKPTRFSATVELYELELELGLYTS